MYDSLLEAGQRKALTEDSILPPVLTVFNILFVFIF